MRSLLILAMLALGAAAPAAGDEQCAAKPFTLNKPAPAKPQARPAPAKPKTVATTAPRTHKPKPAPKIDLSCKDPPRHKPG
jgi:hypothetical protein